MRWSMFSVRDLNAHGHDNGQNSFMALAAMYVEVRLVHREVVWLREWQAFWTGVAGKPGSGVSDLRPGDHLTGDQRIGRLRSPGRSEVPHRDRRVGR